MRENQLASLLLTIFTNSGELERFVRFAFGRSVSVELDQGPDFTEQVYRLTYELTERQLVDDKFFDELLSYAPRNIELIERVRADYVVDLKPRTSDSGLSLSIEGLDEPRSAWRHKLAQTLDAASQSEPELPREWIDAAAVFATFDPIKLQPLATVSTAEILARNQSRGAIDGQSRASPGRSLIQLASHCETQRDGRWRLRLGERRKALARLWDERRLVEAINTNVHERSMHSDYLMDLGNERWIDVRSITRFESLAVFSEVTSWLAGAEIPLWDKNLLTAMMEQFRRIEPLRKLVDSHFTGRDDELSQLMRHAINADTEHHILNLVGIGGVGKSALLGKLLLGLNQSSVDHPWVYLDFDNPALESAQPRKLLEEIIKQLSLIYETLDPDLGFIRLESITAGDQHLKFTVNVPPNATTLDLIKELEHALERVAVAEPRLLVVFDTFEQVQIRGETVLGSFRQFIRDLLSIMPHVRVIISGRAELRWPDAATLKLVDLDLDDADAMLQSYQIQEPLLRQRIVEKIGCNPLSLKLVGQAISTRQLTSRDIDDLLEEVVETNVQGRLYTRILGHIVDTEVRKLAHPGLVVRRVTPGVIANVLADVCELNKDQAEDLFRRLPNYVSLFELDAPTPDVPVALRHRQDLRESMLRLMLADETRKDQLQLIHDRAVAYYEQSQCAVDKAEELYHRLMRGDAVEMLDRLWSDRLKNSLSRSWNEPLPELARAWLGIRLGFEQADSDKLRTVDWEVVAFREASEQLRAGRPAEALATVRRRADRSPASQLYRLEVEILAALNQNEEALELAKLAIQTAVDSGNIHEEMVLELVAASLEVNDAPQRALRRARRAADLSRQLLDDIGLVNALSWIASFQIRFGSDPEISQSIVELEQAFEAIDNTTLHQHPEIAQRVIATVGDRSQHILQKSANTFDNRVHQTLLKQDAFQLELLLKLLNDSPDGQLTLAQLATQFGLSAANLDLIELSSNMVRYGRIGQGVAEVLNAHGEDHDVRHQVLQMFNLPREDRA